MNQFMLVLRTQLLSALGAGRTEKKKKGAAKAVKLSAYAVVWLLLASLAAVYEFAYASIFAVYGVADRFPALIVFASSMLTLIFSITYTKSLIFRSKDHDLLFSLPIKNSTVIAAKLATIYILDLAVTMALLLPCGVIYGIVARPAAIVLVRYFILTLFVPMLPILIAAVISALVSLIASRFRFSKIIGTVIYVALFAVYIAAVMGVSGSTDEDAVMMFMGLTESLKGIYPPLAWFESAFLKEYLQMLLFIAVSLGAFLLVVAVFGKFYGRIHDAFSLFVYRGQYKVSKDSATPKRALLRKEWQRFIASPGVMINQSAGLIAVLLFTGFTVYKCLTSEVDSDMIGMIFPVMAPYFFAMFTAMSDVSAASISLEGRNLWLLKSVPVSARDILKIKLGAHLMICFPIPFVCGILLSFVMKLTLLEAALLIVIPLVYSYNAGVMGLLLNLKKPKLDWVNEVVVAKQSMPVTVTLFTGMIAALVPMIGSVVLFAAFGEDPMISGLVLPAFGGTVILLGIILGGLLTHLLNKHGEALFRKVGE